MATAAAVPHAARISEGELIEYEALVAKLLRAIGRAEEAERAARAVATFQGRGDRETQSVHLRLETAENLVEIAERLIELARSQA